MTKQPHPGPGRRPSGPWEHSSGYTGPRGRAWTQLPLDPGPPGRRVSCPNTGRALEPSSKRAGTPWHWEISVLPGGHLCHTCRVMLRLLPWDSFLLSLTLLWWAWHKQVLSRDSLDEPVDEPQSEPPR